MALPTTAAILLAAGSSSRMSTLTADKVLHPILGKPVIAYSLSAFEDTQFISDYVVVYRDSQQQAKLEAAIEPYAQKQRTIHWIQGGFTRQASVHNALTALPSSIEITFIHDAARPLITPSALQTLFSATLRHNAAVLAHRATDSIKRVQATDPLISPAYLEPLNRAQLWAMETPQAFMRPLIQEAYDFCAEKNIYVTDDTAALHALGHKVQLIETHAPNPKLTTPKDLDYISFLLSKR